MDTTLLLAMLPIIIILLGLELYCLIDLVRRDKRYVQGENKLVWLLLILLFSPIGPISYLAVGRKQGE